MRNFCSVPDFWGRVQTFGEVKMNKNKWTLSVLALLGLAGLMGFVSGAHPQVDRDAQLEKLSDVRAELNRLTLENRMMRERLQVFRDDFNDMSKGFADLSESANKLRGSSETVSDVQVSAADLSFSLLTMESNLQWMERHVKEMKPQTALKAVAAAEKSLTGKTSDRQVGMK